ncbi:hypothetical protein BVY01_01945, partial [bacterium I07]
MKKSIFEQSVFFGVLIVSVLLSRCDGRKTGSKNNQIAVSLYPVYDIVRNVTGDNNTVSWIVPVGANPHHYEPAPSTVRNLHTVSLFIGIHPEIDGWIAESLKPSVPKFFLIPHEENHAHIQPMDAGSMKGTQTGRPEHDHSHTAEQPVNPHIWLSIKKAKHMVEIIEKELSDHYPENGPHYLENASEYIEELNKLDKDIEQLMASLKGHSII